MEQKSLETPKATKLDSSPMFQLCPTQRQKQHAPIALFGFMDEHVHWDHLGQWFYRDQIEPSEDKTMGKVSSPAIDVVYVCKITKGWQSIPVKGCYNMLGTPAFNSVHDIHNVLEFRLKPQYHFVFQSPDMAPLFQTHSIKHKDCVLSWFSVPWYALEFVSKKDACLWTDRLGLLRSPMKPFLPFSTDFFNIPGIRKAMFQRQAIEQGVDSEFLHSFTHHESIHHIFDDKILLVLNDTAQGVQAAYANEIRLQDFDAVKCLLQDLSRNEDLPECCSSLSLYIHGVDCVVENAKAQPVAQSDYWSLLLQPAQKSPSSYLVPGTIMYWKKPDPKTLPRIRFPGYQDILNELRTSYGAKFLDRLQNTSLGVYLTGSTVWAALGKATCDFHGTPTTHEFPISHDFDFIVTGPPRPQERPFRRSSPLHINEFFGLMEDICQALQADSHNVTCSISFRVVTIYVEGQQKPLQFLFERNDVPTCLQRFDADHVKAAVSISKNYGSENNRIPHAFIHGAAPLHWKRGTYEVTRQRKDDLDRELFRAARLNALGWRDVTKRKEYYDLAEKPVLKASALELPPPIQFSDEFEDNIRRRHQTFPPLIIRQSSQKEKTAGEEKEKDQTPPVLNPLSIITGEKPDHRKAIATVMLRGISFGVAFEVNSQNTDTPRCQRLFPNRLVSNVGGDDIEHGSLSDVHDTLSGSIDDPEAAPPIQWWSQLKRLRVRVMHVTIQRDPDAHLGYVAEYRKSMPDSWFQVLKVLGFFVPRKLKSTYRKNINPRLVFTGLSPCGKWYYVIFGKLPYHKDEIASFLKQPQQEPSPQVTQIHQSEEKKEDSDETTAITSTTSTTTATTMEVPNVDEMVRNYLAQATHGVEESQ